MRSFKKSGRIFLTTVLVSALMLPSYAMAAVSDSAVFEEGQQSTDVKVQNTRQNERTDAGSQKVEHKQKPANENEAKESKQDKPKKIAFANKTIEGYLSTKVPAYSEPGKSAVEDIPAGTKIKGVVTDGWVKINYKGKSVYISETYVLKNLPKREGYIEYDVNLHIFPGSSELCGTIRAGAYIEGVQYGNWVIIEHKGKPAFVANSYVVDEAKKVSLVEGYLKHDVAVRSCPGGTIMSRLPVAFHIQDGEPCGAWVKIVYGNKKTGYIPRVFIEKKENIIWATGWVAGKIPFYSTAEKTDIFDYIPINYYIKDGIDCGELVRVNYKGTTGYVEKNKIWDKELDFSAFTSREADVFDLSGNKIGSIPADEYLQGIKTNKGIHILFKNQKALIKDRSFEKAEKKTKYVSSVDANITSKRYGSSAIDRPMYAQKLEGYEKNGWFYVTEGAERGYVSTSKLAKDKSGFKRFSGYSHWGINIRSYPSSTSSKVGYIPFALRFNFGDYEFYDIGKYIKVFYNGVHGYVNHEYLNESVIARNKALLRNKVWARFDSAGNIVDRYETKYGTMASIDLSKQTMTFYRNNDWLFETDIISGKPSSPSPKGHHFVRNMQRNIILRGPGYASHVDYWIAYNWDGYGIHDAYWQYWYTYKQKNIAKWGSHGCINTPGYNTPKIPSYVGSPIATLYRYAYLGMPVFIF